MSNFADRSGYNRLNMFPPVIKMLLLSNVLIFILGFVVPQYIVEIMTPDGLRQAQYGADTIYGGLWPITSEFFLPTQYLTHLFLHGGFGHIFFNMIALWMFGMELEQVWGSKRFLIFYLICGLGAGVTQSIVTYISGDVVPTVGASGAIMGVMVAFAVLNPDRIIYVQLFLPLKAKYAVMLFIGIDLYFGFGGAGDGVARFAHLGGALTGFIMLMAAGKGRLTNLFERKRERDIASAPPPIANRAHVIDVQFRDTNPASNRHAPQMMDFGSEQERIDAILDKISRTGYQTLTDEEKQILTEASKRMR